MTSEDGAAPIHLRKHHLTRRYLNVDDAGHVYRYAGSADDDALTWWSEPLDSLAEAIEHAHGEAEAIALRHVRRSARDAAA